MCMSKCQIESMGNVGSISAASLKLTLNRRMLQIGSIVFHHNDHLKPPPLPTPHFLFLVRIFWGVRVFSWPVFFVVRFCFLIDCWWFVLFEKGGERNFRRFISWSYIPRASFYHPFGKYIWGHLHVSSDRNRTPSIILILCRFRVGAPLFSAGRWSFIPYSTDSVVSMT